MYPSHILSLQCDVDNLPIRGRVYTHSFFLNMAELHESHDWKHLMKWDSMASETAYSTWLSFSWDPNPWNLTFML